MWITLTLDDQKGSPIVVNFNTVAEFRPQNPEKPQTMTRLQFIAPDSKSGRHFIIVSEGFKEISGRLGA